MKELLTISILGVLSLIAGIMKMKRGFNFIVLGGILLNIVFSIADMGGDEIVYGMMRMDRFALTFNILASLIAFIWLLLSSAYFQKDESFSDHYALILFTICGGLILVSFTHMVMLFLGIEILSIPLFVLAGSHKTRMVSNEAAFKYFLLGSFATAFLLFGIALVYGATAHFDLAGISRYLSVNALSPMAFVGIVMIIAAMAFKVSAAPFHFWAPDVYQGSPTMISAYMATFVKTVAFAAFYRLMQDGFTPVQEKFYPVLAMIAALTMLIANFTALVQDNVKRMLAFSGISHAGFMMVTILCIRDHTSGILLFYACTYSISGLMAFSIFKSVKSASREDEEISLFKGLIRRNRSLAAFMAFALLSMSGIPPLAGFMAKYLIFTEAVSNGFIWVTVTGIIASLLAVCYYFRLILTIFGNEADAAPFKITTGRFIILGFCAFLLIALMVVPHLVINLI